MLYFLSELVFLVLERVFIYTEQVGRQVKIGYMLGYEGFSSTSLNTER